MNIRSIPICVDFDGTIVKHAYPAIGDPIPLALDILTTLSKLQHVQLILFTMRSGDSLAEAVEYLKSNGIRLYGVNTNPTQKSWTSSPKAYGAIYIDDAALGCPLIRPKGELPYVDWYTIQKLLFQEGVFF